ncbi:MAG TPA: DUF2058 domain-containing protein [Porticoccus sp.]|nr:DUF2058 domain-containing protein [Porticoccus sp.]
MRSIEKIEQVEQEKRKQTKQSHKGHTQVNETKELAKKALAEKTARDREINRQREAEAELKAIAAQIRQLIEVNRIDRQGGETAYQFTDGTKIKKIYVSPLLHNQLSKGLIAVVRLNDQYELVPTMVADKISQRDENIVLVQNQASKGEIDEDDYYADYKIPDDLMW